MKFKYIVFLLIFYAITYFKIGFRFENLNKDSYLTTTIIKENLIKRKLIFAFKNDGSNVIRKNILLKKENIFNYSTAIYEKEFPPSISDSKSPIVFFTLPFFIKKITVNSIIEVNNQKIYLEHSYTPYLEFGIYSFWHWLIPPTWEFTRKIPLLKID